MIDDEALRSIEKLHQMKQSGIISEADFDKAKEELLAGRPRSKPIAIPRALTDFVTNAELPAESDWLGWMLLPLRRYAQFEGRSSRKEFWMFQLFVSTVGGLFGITCLLMGQPGLVLFIFGLLGILVPQIALQVRRFHDQDKSGWFALLNLFPYVGALIVLIFMFFDGTAGPNQYGDDPKGR